MRVFLRTFCIRIATVGIGVIIALTGYLSDQIFLSEISPASVTVVNSNIARVGLPVTMEIPRFSAIIPITTQSQVNGAIQISHATNTASWYHRSVRPSESGVSVLTSVTLPAHTDLMFGTSTSRLQIGDIVVVRTVDHELFRFVVVKRHVYDIQEPLPVETIFIDRSVARLNLFMCHDRDASTIDECRVLDVVFTKLIPTPKTQEYGLAGGV